MEGLSLLREEGDLSVLARGLNMLAMSHLRVGSGDKAIAAAEEARQTAVLAGDKSKEATSLSYLTVINMYLGRYAEALGYGRSAMSLAEQIEDRRRMAYTADFIGRVQLSIGEWGEATRLFEEDVPQIRAYAPGYLPWALLYRGLGYDEVGATDLARTSFAECSGIDTASASFWQPIVMARACYARLTDDEGLLQRVIHEMEALPWDEFFAAAAESLLPMGQTFVYFGAYSVLAKFVDLRSPGVERVGSPNSLGALSLLKAHLAAHRGAIDAAVTHLDQGLQSSRACGNLLTVRYLLELRLKLLNEQEDREALLAVNERLAASLPEDLRATFLASPRVMAVLAGTI
jgi:tetratricopeptide (TPR) repeat protein